MGGNKIKIEEKKLLLVEGADAYWFFIWYSQYLDIQGLQVMDFGGITQLTDYILGLQKLDNYENVQSIIICRDAETNVQGAMESIKNSLSQTGLAVPNNAFQIDSSSAINTAFMILPGFDENNNLSNGALEDLCLKTVEGDTVFSCVDQYMNCIEQNHHSLTHKHKTKLHSYLSVKNGKVGLKIGEATKAGVWNLNHDVLEPFKNVLLNI